MKRYNIISQEQNKLEEMEEDTDIEQPEKEVSDEYHHQVRKSYKLDTNTPIFGDKESRINIRNWIYSI